MKRHALSFMVLVGMMGSQIVWAQEDYNEGLKAELNQEINQLYPKKQKAIRTAQKGITVQEVSADTIQAAPATPTTINVTTQAAPQPVVQQQPAAAPAAQPIYIMQAPVQQQPTQTIEAAPVKETRIDALRKQREEIERQTEEKILQRLEDDRLLSEKDRADKLLNPSAAAAASATTVPTQTAPVIGAPVQQNGFTPVQAVSAPTAVVGSTVAPVEDITPANPEEETMLQVGGALGVGDYPTVSNVQGVYATGVNVSLVTPGGLGVDGSLMFSSYDVKNPQAVYPYAPLTRMDQLNVTAGLSYQILSGRVRPVIGALAGYTRRSFDNSVYYSNTNTDNSVSHAIDAGTLFGVDVQVAKKLTVGADIRYMMNLSSRTDNPYAYYGTVGKPIESLSYYFATLNLKLQL